MKNLADVTHTSRLLQALPLLADALTVIALLLSIDYLSALLAEPSGWNALLLSSLYVLFALGVYLLRKLEPAPAEGPWSPPSFFLDRRVRGVLAAFFGLFLVTTIAYQLGFFASIQSLRAGTLEEGSTAAFFVFAPGAWLGFSMLYILILAFPVVSNVPTGSPRYTWNGMLGLVAVNALFVVTAAQARGMLAQWGWLGSPITFLASALVLLLSYAPPRLAYQRRQPFLPGLVSLGVLLLLTALLIAR